MCLIRVPAGPSQGVIVQAIEKETDWYADVLDRARRATGHRSTRHAPSKISEGQFARACAANGGGVSPFTVQARSELVRYVVVVASDLVAMTNLYVAHRSSDAPAQGVVARLNPALLMLPPSKNM